MELVAKNLLVCITTLAALAFALIWANRQNTPFVMEFSFMRERNRRNDLVLGGKIIAVVSLVSYIIYGVAVFICKTYISADILQTEDVPVWGLLLPVLVMIYHLFRLSESHVGENAIGLVLNIFFVYIGPSILIFLMPFMRKGLDRYAGYFSVAMLPLIIWAAYRNRKAWREGDC